MSIWGGQSDLAHRLKRKKCGVDWNVKPIGRHKPVLHKPVTRAGLRRGRTGWPDSPLTKLKK